jgi:transcriptional regulator with XRE-family HTH domain
MSEMAERFGANLLRCRRRMRLSQEELAERASLHRTEIGLLEHGRRLPRLDTVVKLAASMDIEVDELVAGIAWVVGGQRCGAFVLGSEPIEARRPRTE